MSKEDDLWDSEYRRLFRSCYGAAFALMARDHMREGRGAPTSDDYDRFDEEAGTIACEAAQRAEFKG